MDGLHVEVVLVRVTRLVGPVRPLNSRSISSLAPSMHTGVTVSADVEYAVYAGTDSQPPGLVVPAKFGALAGRVARFASRWERGRARTRSPGSHPVATARPRYSSSEFVVGQG